MMREEINSISPGRLATMDRDRLRIILARDRRRARNHDRVHAVDTKGDIGVDPVRDHDLRPHHHITAALQVRVPQQGHLLIRMIQAPRAVMRSMIIIDHRIPEREMNTTDDLDRIHASVTGASGTAIGIVNTAGVRRTASIIIDHDPMIAVHRLRSRQLTATSIVHKTTSSNHGYRYATNFFL